MVEKAHPLDRSVDSTSIDAQRKVVRGNSPATPDNCSPEGHASLRKAIPAPPGRKRRMNTRGIGKAWQLLPILGIGLAATLVAGMAAGGLGKSGAPRWHTAAPAAAAVTGVQAAAQAKASPADLAI